MNAGGETVLGAPAGEGGEAMARSVARLLEGAGLGVCWVVPHREREEMLMRKLVVNSIINPLTVPLVCPPSAAFETHFLSFPPYHAALHDQSFA